MSINTAALRRLLRGAEVDASVAEFLLVHHGAAVHAFAPLIAKFPKEAAADLLLIDTVLASEGLSSWGIEAGWDALRRLNALAHTGLGDPIRSAVGIQLKRRMETLFARETDYVDVYAEDLAEAAAKMSKAPTDKVLQDSGAAVLAELSRTMPSADPQLVLLWRHFDDVVQSSVDAALAMQRVAEIAAERAPAFKELLEMKVNTPLEVANRELKLWGHVSKIRGEMGELYGLGNKRWLLELDSELARVDAIVLKLGPDYQRIYLTQAMHQLRMNGGGEGPDALLAIINTKTRKIYEATKVQVKTAKESAGGDQTLNDVFRSAGEEKAGPATATVYRFRLTKDGPEEVMPLLFHPDIQLNAFIINASGSKMPREDLELLDAMTLGVKELGLDLSVTQFTHLAISLIEAAIRIAK